MGDRSPTAKARYEARPTTGDSVTVLLFDGSTGHRGDTVLYRRSCSAPRALAMLAKQANASPNGKPMYRKP